MDTLIQQLWYLLSNYQELFIEGIINTLLIALFGTIIGMVLGMILLFFRTLEATDYDSKIIIFLKAFGRKLSAAYIDIVRGTPMMVQAMIFFYGFASGIKMPVFYAAIFIVSFNTAAYIAEVIRSGVNALGKGSFEAAYTLGMSKFQTLRYVVYPQVIKNSLPALLNELIINVKDSSVLSVIGFTDLFYNAKAASSETYMTVQAFILVAIIYLIITFSLTKIISLISKKVFENDTKLLQDTNQNLAPEVSLGGAI
ncbi:amino acid ABC transporter permease [Mycoplasma sp. P36-A1]|uniref:amino acid ABC transporter permease n=1 Tax=Mycoplasma sp. P36-A1 TaxID=3252900 RepID=UPI003C2CD2F7